MVGRVHRLLSVVRPVMVIGSHAPAAAPDALGALTARRRRPPAPVVARAASRRASAPRYR